MCDMKWIGGLDLETVFSALKQVDNLCPCSDLISDPTEVYTWGNNTNFSLGHGNQESRHHPEIVDLFSRSGIYVKQVNVF